MPPLYEYAHDIEGECDDFDIFAKMTDATLELCPDCGMPVHRILSIPRMIMKSAPEDPQASTRRILGLKRDEQVFESPWVNEEGENETVHLTGSKAERKAQAQDCILRTKQAKKRNLKRSDIDINI